MDPDPLSVSTNPAAFIAVTSVLNMSEDMAVSTISAKISPPLKFNLKDYIERNGENHL